MTTARIEVRCPYCKIIGYIEVSEEEIKNIKRGVLAVNIAENFFCSHSFVAYVDKNKQIRDYMMADFKIEIPKVIPEQKQDKEGISTIEINSFDLIKYNVPPSLLTNVIRAILLKKKVVIISDEQYLHNNLENFIKYITKGSFNFDLSILTLDDYNKKSDNFNSCIILDGKEIRNDADNLMEHKKLKIETRIVQDFFAEYDLSTSIIFLKNELQKTFEMAKTLIDFIPNPEKNEKINSKKLINHLKNKYNIKIQSSYLDFLIDVIKNYFS